MFVQSKTEMVDRRRNVDLLAHSAFRLVYAARRRRRIKHAKDTTAIEIHFEGRQILAYRFPVKQNQQPKMFNQETKHRLDGGSAKVIGIHEKAATDSTR